MESVQTSPYLNTEGAAAWLGLSAAYLDLLRVKGGGPSYRKLGRRVLYRREDLEAWAEAQRRTSTSQKGA